MIVLQRKTFTSFLMLLLFFPFVTVYAEEEVNELIYFGCSFTQGDSWAKYLSEHYGKTAVGGSTNFAVGGTKTLYLTVERNAYYGTHPSFNNSNIYLTYMGPNDFQGYAEDIDPRFAMPILNYDYGVLGTLPGQIGPNTAVFLNQRIGLYVAHAINLINHGATNLVIFNHLNEEHRHPQYAIVYPGLVNSIVEEWNKRLIQSLSTVSANIIIVDFYRLTTEISQNEGSYVGAGSAFYDATSHPTQRGYVLMANYVASLIDAPILVGSTRESVIRMGEIHNENILSELQILKHDYHGFKAIILGNIEYTNFNKNNKGNPKGFSGLLSDGGIGALYARSNFVLGASLGKYYQPFDFSDNSGKATVDEILGSIFGRVNFAERYNVMVVLGFGQANYEIKRNILLGLQNREEKGKTNGNHMFGNIQFGSQFDLIEDYVVSPFIGIELQKVKGFSYKEEGGIRSTNMSFNIADRNSVKPHIGTIIKKAFIYNNIEFIPQLKLNLAYELIEPKASDLQAQLLSIPRRFYGFYAVNIPRFIGNVQLGTSIIKGDLEFSINYNMAQNFTTVNNHQVHAVLKYALGRHK